MAMMRGVTYVRSRSKPSSWKRFFFFETNPRILSMLAVAGGPTDYRQGNRTQPRNLMLDVILAEQKQTLVRSDSLSLSLRDG